MAKTAILRVGVWRAHEITRQLGPAVRPTLERVGSLFSTAERMDARVRRV